MAKKEKTETEQLTPQQEKMKALQAALSKIEKDFGKGSIMRMGDEQIVPVEAIPTGSIGLNAALGVGGYPKGRIIEIYGPESRHCRVSENGRRGRLHRCRARLRPLLCREAGCGH